VKAGPTPAESEAWLIKFCEDRDMPRWPTVKSAILEQPVPTNLDASQSETQEVYKDSEYWTFYGRDAHCDVPDEFWQHAENALGVQIPNKVPYFSCSC
jgi:hypothetical protein